MTDAALDLPDQSPSLWRRHGVLIGRVLLVAALIGLWKLGADAAGPRYAADPFGLEEGDALHVFFEDYDQSMANGIISHVEVSSDGTWSPTEPILDPG